MRPPHLHDTTEQDSNIPPERQWSPDKRTLSPDKRQRSPDKKSVIIEKRPAEMPKSPKKIQNNDNGKSHAMMVQATAKDILNFESVCSLSELYKFGNNRIIYELHSEFISIRDMQKSMYQLDNDGIPAKLFVKYCNVLNDKTPLIQKRFLRAFGIDFDKNQKKNKMNQDDRSQLLQKLANMAMEQKVDDSAPDTFVSWRKFLHLNALMKYQKGTPQMFIDLWVSLSSYVKYRFTLLIHLIKDQLK